MKKMLLLLLSLVPMSLEVLALTPAQKGLEIATEADRRDTGYGNFTAELTMVIADQRGRETVRQLRRQTLEMPDDGDKDLNIFDSPPDVKRTVVLTYTHALEPDDQWIFLPGLKRVKRISSVNKSGPFMGSEFAYEDIAKPEVAKYTYKYLYDEVVNGHDCFVNELVPAYPHSGYTRLIQWMDKTMYQPVKIVYYDRKDVLLKTLVYQGYKQYLGRYWRPSEMVMENHQTGKKTRLIWDNYRFQVGLNEQDFSKAALKRTR